MLWHRYFSEDTNGCFVYIYSVVMKSKYSNNSNNSNNDSNNYYYIYKSNNNNSNCNTI